MDKFWEAEPYDWLSPLGRRVQRILRPHIEPGALFDAIECEYLADAIHERASEIFRDRRLRERQSRSLLRSVMHDVVADFIARRSTRRPFESHPLGLQSLSPEMQRELAELARRWPNESYGELIKRVRRMSEQSGDDLYDLSETEVAPKAVVATAEPLLLVAGDAIARRLQGAPEGVHSLSPRQFEILVAEILEDKGWDVRLTPATRDGGQDILAFLDSDVGRLLCLVEAKRYARHHKVGFGVVQRLYGAFSSYGASHAMLVTTSAFTVPAQELQRKHQYQLSLRDYLDVVRWIGDYGRGSSLKTAAPLAQSRQRHALRYQRAQEQSSP